MSDLIFYWVEYMCAAVFVIIGVASEAWARRAFACSYNFFGLQR